MRLWQIVIIIVGVGLLLWMGVRFTPLVPVGLAEMW